MSDDHKTTVIRYERQDDLFRLTMTNVTNHELREVIIGLWCRLDAADRADHLAAIRHYLDDPDAWLSPIASAIKLGDAGESTAGESTIDLKALIARGEKIRP